MGTKILTDCPKCSKRMRIPINYIGTLRCPKCKFQFDKIPKLDPETIDEEEPEKTNRCTYCGEINEVVSGFTGYYRCKHCGYDVLTLEQSEKIKERQERRINHWTFRYNGRIKFLIEVIIACGFIGYLLIKHW